MVCFECMDPIGEARRVYRDKPFCSEACESSFKLRESGGSSLHSPSPLAKYKFNPEM